jgi:hypothetical protein
MTLKATEFIRRFALHILPKGFVRIRHYGILSSKVKASAIPVIRLQLQNTVTPMQSNNLNGPPIVDAEQRCPCCKKGIMNHVMNFDFRGPPSLKMLEKLLIKLPISCNLKMLCSPAWKPFAIQQEN